MALGAQQAHRLLAGECRELLEPGLRPRRRELLAEDPAHEPRVARAGGLAARLRRAEVDEVPVANALLGQSLAQRALGESPLARERDGAHVRQHRYAGALQGRDEAV